MITGLNTSEEEATIIWNSFSTWSNSFRRHLEEKGFLFLLEKYDKLITSIELVSGIGSKPMFAKEVKPYNLKRDLADYTNDLSTREAIERIYDIVSEAEKERLDKKIKILDYRFKNLLSGDVFVFNIKSIDEYPKSKYWWYYGYPKIIK